MDRSPTMNVLVPYLVGLAAQLPMLFLYFRGIWAKPHYQFFPIALVTLIAFAYMRWPRGETNFRRSWLGSSLLVLAAVFGLAAMVYVEPWFAAACSVALSASLFSMVTDKESGRSLLSISLLGLICLTPPFGFDSYLITALQQISARITSNMLDLVGYPHFMPGTVILAPGTEGFGIEEACSGVQSFFTLLFIATFFIVLFRRPWFRATLLLLSVFFWAIFMNTLRIFTIPLAVYFLNWDLAHGLAHALLGYGTLALGILMVYSTDQFLLFLCGPTEKFGDDGGQSFVSAITRFWNFVISGEQNNDDRKKRVSRSISKTMVTTIWGVAGVLALLGVISVVDVFRSLYQPDIKIKFFDTNVEVPLAKADLDENTMGGWQLVDYTNETRNRGSDLGRLSNTWTFMTPSDVKDEKGEVIGRFVSTFSFDQPFPGWHELSTCYKNQGWEIVQRRTRIEKIEGSETEWPYVTVQMKNSVGQYAILVFSMFDSFGEPYIAPGNWNVVGWLIQGSANRMRNRIRGSLFRGEAYQEQLFVTQYREISPAMEEIVTDKFLSAREHIRKKFLERRKRDELSAPEEPTPAADKETN